MASQSKSRQTFIISIVLHVFILAALIVSFEFNSRNFVLENTEKTPDVVNALIVTDSKIEMPDPAPVPTPTPIPTPKQKIIPPKPAETKPIVKTPPQTTKKPEPVVEKKTIAIPDPRKKLFQKELIEKQLLADLKQTQKQQKKQKHQELEKAFEKELKAQAAKSLQQQLLLEQKRVASAQAQKMHGIVDKYNALIQQAIRPHWLIPNGVDKGISTKLLIHLAPGGVVLDVQLVKSSGSESLDRSARAAIFKASPLPVPGKSDEFEPFRQFILTMKPENVLARDAGLS